MAAFVYENKYFVVTSLIIQKSKSSQHIELHLVFFACCQIKVLTMSQRCDANRIYVHKSSFPFLALNRFSTAN